MGNGQRKAVKGVYEVVYPLGRSTAKATPLPVHIPDLSGKTICGSGHSFEGDEAVAAVVALLQKQSPGIKFVPNAEIPAEASTKEEMAKLQDLLRGKGCDAVLSAMGC